MKLIKFVSLVFLLQSAFNVSVAGKKKTDLKGNHENPSLAIPNTEQENVCEMFIKVCLQELECPDSYSYLNVNSFEFLKENKVFKLLSFMPGGLAKPISSGSWAQNGSMIEMQVRKPGLLGKLALKKCYFRRNRKNPPLSPLLKLIKLWLAQISLKNGQTYYFCWCEKGLSEEVTFENFNWYIPFPAANQVLTTTGWAFQSMEDLKKERGMTEESLIGSTIALCMTLGVEGFTKEDLLNALPDYSGVSADTQGEFEPQKVSS